MWFLFSEIEKCWYKRNGTTQSINIESYISSIILKLDYLDLNDDVRYD